MTWRGHTESHRSCPGMTRASTSYFKYAQDVNGWDKPGHDEEKRKRGKEEKRKRGKEEKRLVVPMLRQRQPESLHQIRHLRRRQIARVQPAQQQIEFCGL